MCRTKIIACIIFCLLLNHCFYPTVKKVPIMLLHSMSSSTNYRRNIWPWIVIVVKMKVWCSAQWQWMRCHAIKCWELMWADRDIYVNEGDDNQNMVSVFADLLFSQSPEMNSSVPVIAQSLQWNMNRCISIYLRKHTERTDLRRRVGIFP